MQVMECNGREFKEITKVLTSKNLVFKEGKQSFINLTEIN